MATVVAAVSATAQPPNGRSLPGGACHRRRSDEDRGEIAGCAYTISDSESQARDRRANIYTQLAAAGATFVRSSFSSLAYLLVAEPETKSRYASAAARFTLPQLV